MDENMITVSYEDFKEGERAKGVLDTLMRISESGESYSWDAIRTALKSMMKEKNAI